MTYHKKISNKTNKKTPSTITNSASKSALLLAAAMALPAINIAHAETAPEHGIISFKYLDYLDSQNSVVPDAYSGASSSQSKDRIKVKAQSLLVMAPIAGEWSITGTYTGDSISGASPAYHTNQLRKLEEHRDAGSIGITRYLPRGSISIGANQSNENDYFSRGFSLQGTVASEDKNTTFNAGVSVSNDAIDSSNHVAFGETKHVTDWILGVTQVITVNDIVQLNLGYSEGNGYFNDPYKTADKRPNSKDHYTILTRWNHYFNQTKGSSHLSYRYYDDTYGVEAHTISAEYIQPFGNGWTVMPLARFYTQTAADFYVGVSPYSPEFPNPRTLKYISLDQRLSEYGALTWGVKLSKQINPDWLIDFKYEQYKQKESWALTGNNNGGLEPFNFRSYQFGISRRF
jgi:hypothetical protein